MLPAQPRRPASKASGVVLLVFGIMALSFAGFAMVSLTATPMSYRILVSSVLAIYGIWRIFSGLAAIRKAAEAEQAVRLAGSTAGAANPPGMRAQSSADSNTGGAKLR